MSTPGRGRTAPALRSLAFAAAFSVAVVLGRLTIIDGQNLSLVWPAGGVAAAWFCLQRHAGTRLLDLTLLSATTFTLNLLTGAPAGLAVVFVLANLAQVLVFTALVGRWCPLLWGGGGAAPLTTVRDLVRILAAASAAVLAGCVLGLTGAALTGGHPSWLDAGVWLTRNAAGIVLVVPCVLRMGQRLAIGNARRPFDVVGTRTRELTAALVVSGAVYAGVYGAVHGLPLGFAPLAVTVWVALRFDTTILAAHNITLATSAVLFTLAGRGPLAAIPDDVTRALVVQLDISLIGVVGLVLALGRDERDTSLQEAVASTAEAERRGRLTDAVLKSVDVGIAVVDPAGELVLANDTARSWHGDDQVGPLPYEVLRPDGTTPLPAAERPLHRALSEGSVSGVEMVIAPGGQRRVPVVASAHTMTADDGTPLGTVVAMHDLTDIRARETALALANARLAAQVSQVERLATAARAVLTADDPRRAVCEAAADVCRADAAYLLQPVRGDDGAVRLVSTSTVGLPEATSLQLDPERDTSLVLTAYHENRQVFVADVPAHPQANRGFVEACGTVSAVWQPVTSPDGDVTGILAVIWRRTVDVLEATTAAVLDGLAAEAAHAFRRADLLAQMSRDADHDALTGLVNRRRWDACAQLEITRAERGTGPLTFALLDLDHFKAYNDTRGHLAGDDLLRRFTAAAAAQLRDLDTLARWGGEEFVLALPGCSAADARIVVDRIRAVVPDGQTCTVGVSEWTPGDTAADVVQRADEALYQGKGSGRNTTVVARSQGSVTATG